jgi:hypothetical protein
MGRSRSTWIRYRSSVGSPPACLCHAFTQSTTPGSSPPRAPGVRGLRHLCPQPRRMSNPRSGCARADIASGPNFCSAHSSTVSTASHAGEVTGPVRVTHPFHPLCGQELDVLTHRVQWGESRVFYRDVRGHRVSMPVCWTSLAAPDPYLAIGPARSRFRFQDLIELAALLAERRQ